MCVFKSLPLSFIQEGVAILCVLLLMYVHVRVLIYTHFLKNYVVIYFGLFSYLIYF